MRVAVVGAGLAGLGVTYFLLKRGYLVTLFDERGVGGGASGIPIGLCHPYLGRSGKPSKFAGEALLLTNELIIAAENSSKKKLADRSGILRVDWTPYEMYSDLEKVDEGILIKSGMTVFLKENVDALYGSFENVILEERKISPEHDLKEFDRIVYTCGSGNKDMGFALPMTYVKGQVVIGNSKNDLEMTLMKEKGHLSPLGDGRVQLGSTYEHYYDSDEPNEEVALKNLSKKMSAFFPTQDDFVFNECKAGVRACVKVGYLPIVMRLSEKAFIFTGLGSRGLLYHAYYGRHLADMII